MPKRYKFFKFFLWSLFLFLSALLILATISRARSNLLSLVDINEYFVGLVLIPVLSLSFLLIVSKKFEKFTKITFILWFIFTILLICSSLFYFRNVRSNLIKNHCDKLASIEADKEAKKKGYADTKSDTYFVIYELTKQRINNECLYSYGLIKTLPNGWNFDWLPNAN